MADTKDFVSFIKANWLADNEINYLEMTIKDFEIAFAIYTGLDCEFFAFKPSNYNDPMHFVMSEKLDRRGLKL